VSLQVLTTPEADAQIREIENWWRRNRTASPDLFADELEATFDILGHAPHIGRLYRQSRYRTRVGSYSRELAITSTMCPGVIR
jgi:plasmid stabilization system protein ParE